MTSKEPTLLGFVDYPIPGVDVCSYQVNKIGGTPDWIHLENHSGTVSCQVCSRECALVAQIYCPLGQNSPHRTLYLFCCTNNACWNRSESWQVLRCQNSEHVHQGSTEDHTERGTLNETSWLASQDDWDDNALSSATENLTLPQNPVPDVVSSSVTAMDDDLNDNDMSSSQVIPEPLKVTHAGEFPWKVAGNVAPNLISKPIFHPFYVSVTEESDYEGYSSQHINDLVVDYQQHDGNPFAKVRSSSAADSSSANGAESYEKSEVKHGDRCFYKFQKALSKAPQQVIRYQWSGSPLLMRPSEASLPVCQNCGSQRVFEFQLLPALVSALKLQGQPPEYNDPPVEFGTVIVSSCKASCWKNGDVAKSEHVLVQSDPDEDLFTMQ